MRLQRYSLLLYIAFVLFLIVLSAWWMYFFGREGEHYMNYNLQRYRTDRIHAAYILRSMPEARVDPQGQLGAHFPHLIFTQTPQGIEVSIDPAAEEAVREESRRRRRMFLWEGSFFLIVLLGGATLVTIAYRREQDLRQSRELFLAGVSHEFKTPLASLLLYNETLAREELDGAARTRIRDRMGEDILRLRDMVEQVLAVSRAGSPSSFHPQALDLAQETEGTLEQLAPLIANAGAILSKSLPPGCLVMGDAQALGAVLRNLLCNALRHGGEKPLVNVRLEAGDRWHRLTVSDSGPGIPRQEQRRIFRSFYRVGESDRRPQGSFGTGLGLYLVKRNVKAMRGRVELESELGRGAHFSIVLPALRGGARASKKEQA